VVFKAPPHERQDYIKRVIGLPGDLVQVKKGVVYLNGQAVPKKRIGDLLIPVTQNMIDAARKEGEQSPCFRTQFETTGPGGTAICRYPQYRETLPNGKSYNVLDLENSIADDTEVFVVPEGQLFLMGDNRDRSADSRFPAVDGAGIGMVPEKNLVGRALISVFSTDGSANWFLPWTWFTAARFNRIGEGF
jgi:signal peptidase I